MKKFLILALALIMALSLAACGGKTDPAPSGNDTTDPGTSQQEPSNTPDESTPSGGDMTDWTYSDYAEYTEGVPEPEFVYTVSGILNEAFSFKSEATADEINAWKQTLLDSGAEEVREGDTWAVRDGAHLIEMNGITNGVAYFYINLDDTPVSGGQLGLIDTPNNGGSETSGGEVDGIEWPDNEFTQQVPKPEKAMIKAAEDMSGVQFAFVMEMSLEDAAAYAQQLIEAGYDGEWNEQAKMFSGKSENGYRAELMYDSETEIIFYISKVQ